MASCLGKLKEVDDLKNTSSDIHQQGAVIDKIGAGKRRRNSGSGNGGRAAYGRGVMVIMASAIVALISAWCNGSGKSLDSYPHLRKFLQESDMSASKAIQGDVSSTCTDPKRWLNPAGKDLLSTLPGFDRYNASMIWGTYRPGVYFGFKTRTSPEAVTAGLMWHGGDGHSRVDAVRHECNEGDGLGPYGWVEHDGMSYGKQEVADKKAGVSLVTSMVKPAQLQYANAGEDGAGPDVNMAARVEVSPYSGAGGYGLSTVYFYVGLDCSSKTGCSPVVAENGGLAVVDLTKTSQGSLLVKGSWGELGHFELETSAFSTSTSGVVGEGAEGGPTVAFVGKANIPIVDVKRDLEKMQAEHKRSPRRPQHQVDTSARRPFVLPNTVDDDSNIVLVQVTGQAPFTLDLVFRGAASKRDPASEGKQESSPKIPAETVTGWLESGSKKFSDRFEKTFSLEDKGFQPEEIAAAKAALSNLLGGMGYFTGKSEVREAGRNGHPGTSFEAKLFTAVPSRSFFPRGFLWDEGFHQLLVNAWNRPTSIDVLGHWLSLLHVHDESRNAGIGVSGGWLPREQILGEEARRRVPSEFIAQGVDVANPPTLLLLVDSLLQGISDTASNNGNARVERCTQIEGGMSMEPICASNPPVDESGLEATMQFLTKAQPLLDQWMRWMLVTQRPGAKGWGGTANGSPVGAFQWRGRDPSDDRLNALTLASGLDDYPRASHPSPSNEWHVDVLCWLALGCRTMDRLAGVVGVESVPYGEIFDEIVRGMFNLHWDQETEAFFDYGEHVSDGELVNEATMRCQKADGSTVDVGVLLEDLEARKVVCPPNQRHLYPLGDGRGGLLLRRRWRGGSPKSQQVHHIGYVSIFPLVLKLLPAESPALGSLLAHMRDSTELWSPHGLRSLSVSDPLYQVENNPGDEPYWRGHIWVNVNYLALAALRHYSQLEGPVRQEAGRIYSELRTNLLRTLVGGYRSTGYFWEQYDDRTGRGLRSHPFTGWTALVVLIMAEIY